MTENRFHGEAQTDKLLVGLDFIIQELVMMQQLITLSVQLLQIITELLSNGLERRIFERIQRG